MSVNPKVFISYAGEDANFAEAFATKLRERGLDAWFALWEISPGDSLVDKIFEEGLKDAKAVIVILSKNSVNKRWVREELNAGLIKRVQDNTRLIPVVLDDCHVPESLRSIVWVKIENINNFDAEVEKIVASILDHHERPSVGPAPRYVQTILDSIPGFTHTDSLVLKLACEKAIEIGYPFISTETISNQSRALDIPEDFLFETLEILDARGYIKGLKAIGSQGIEAFSITLLGFEEYARVYIDNYDTIVERVAAQIINAGSRDGEKIARELDKPSMLVGHILRVLNSKGLIGVLEAQGGGILVVSVSPELKRTLNRK